MEPVGVIGMTLFLLAQTQLLSHITKRLVDRIGLRDAGGEPVVVVIECGENVPEAHPASALDVGDLILSPPPRRFVALSAGYETPGELFVGIILDGWGGASPMISFASVTLDQPVTLAAPPNAVGVLFAFLPKPAASSEQLRLMKIVDCVSVEDHQVVCLY